MTSELAPEPVILCGLSDDFSVGFEATGSWPKGAVLPATHRSARAPDAPEHPIPPVQPPWGNWDTSADGIGVNLLMELG